MLKVSKRKRDKYGRFINYYKHKLNIKNIEELYLKRKKSLCQIAKIYDCDKSAIKKILVDNKIKIRNIIKSRQPGTEWHKKFIKRIKNTVHMKYKPGKHINYSNYICLTINGKSYAEHKLIMEKILRRKLKKGECVHHIDGDRQNNKKYNLSLCENKGKHGNVHYSLQFIAYELVKMGIIKFNRNTSKYYIPIPK